VKKILWRAANDDYVDTGYSFAEKRSIAEAYLDNPGFGGANIYRTKIEVDDDVVLDLTEKSTLNLTQRHAGKPGAVERAAEALRKRVTPKPLLTPLELTVLCRVARNEDPHAGTAGGVGSRRISQALGRLRRKGMLEAGQWPYRLTTAGSDRYTALGVPQDGHT